MTGPQSVSPKISLQGSTPYLFALERASGTHNNSVQRIAVPTHPPHMLCSVPVPLAYSNKFRLAAIEALLFRIPFVPWSAAERNGHNNEAIFKCSYTKNRSVECVHIFASFVCRIWFIQHTSLYLAKDI